MLKAEQNTKSYLPANKRSNFDLNLSSHTNLSCENFCFVECSLSIRQQDIGILKMSPARYVAKKVDWWKVTKSMVFSEASLESTKFHVIKCPRINLSYNPSNISGNWWNFPIKSGLTVNNKLEVFQIFYEMLLDW